MAMRQTRITLGAFLCLLLFCVAPISAQKHPRKKAPANSSGLPEIIWRDTGSVASLDLIYGAGGKEHAPNPSGKYRFIKEDMQGTSPKFDVEDARGVRWKVKLGHESQSETAATRLLWAAGYFVDEDFYVPKLKVTGLPKLQRGGDFVSPDGTVRRARLERHLKGVKKLGSWDWFENPFVDTRELNGLRVMMALLNNWDLNAYNNAIYEASHERRYLVNDVGATFGKTGDNFSRTKGVLSDYAGSKFIETVGPDSVDFVMHSRPFALSAVNFRNYRKRTEMEEIAKHVPRSDAKWLGQRLAQLSDKQIRDCFHAAGYAPQEIDGYAKVVEKRIAELNAL